MHNFLSSRFSSSSSICIYDSIYNSYDVPEWNFSSLYEFASSISYVSQVSEHRKNVASFLSSNLSFSTKRFLYKFVRKDFATKVFVKTDIALPTNILTVDFKYVSPMTLHSWWNFIKIFLIKFIWPVMHKQTFNIRNVNTANSL